jgi:hypothetical protein
MTLLLFMIPPFWELGEVPLLATGIRCTRCENQIERVTGDCNGPGEEEQFRNGKRLQELADELLPTRGLPPRRKNRKLLIIYTRSY